jgi:uncharacterized protein YkwD
MGRKLAFVLVTAASGAAFLASAADAMDMGRLVAPTAVCADQTDPGAPVSVQERAMRCMTNYARGRIGLGPLGDTGKLDRSARDRSGDMIRCDSFSHYACGRQLTYWLYRVGYIPAPCWRAGENLAWGSGKLGSVHAVFRDWIHSSVHRENILGRYRQIGIGLVTGPLAGHADAHVWTQHFGSHCGRPH